MDYRTKPIIVHRIEPEYSADVHYCKSMAQLDQDGQLIAVYCNQPDGHDAYSQIKCHEYRTHDDLTDGIKVIWFSVGKAEKYG